MVWFLYWALIELGFIGLRLFKFDLVWVYRESGLDMTGYGPTPFYVFWARNCGYNPVIALVRRLQPTASKRLRRKKRESPSQLGHRTRVGECCMGNKKIPTHMQDLSMEMHSFQRGSVSTYPCRSLSGSVKNEVDVVVRLHDPIAISPDQAPNERHLHISTCAVR